MDAADRGDAAALAVLVVVGLVQLAWWGLRRLAGHPWPMPPRTSGSRLPDGSAR